MLLRMLYDEDLAQASYLIGCPAAKAALVVDPLRDVDRYLALASQLGLEITAVTETHVHADFISGTRELAERTGATVFVSGEGGEDWRYRWLDQKIGGGSYRHRVLRDGDEFEIGAVRFKVIHTPGHTPEHICFMVCDRAGNSAEPMGVLTGDFVFVGDLGRPDLLESAVGQLGATERGVIQLHSSTQKFLGLPDYLQIWPGHGAGSACGKHLGAVPQSTVGYERRFSAALQAAGDLDRFRDVMEVDLPEPPSYFARMKRENLSGPKVLEKLPQPARVSFETLAPGNGEVTVLDTRPWPAFICGHAPGALSTPDDRSFSTIAGCYVDPDLPVYLVCDSPDGVDGLVRRLVRVGIDNVAGYVLASDIPESVLETTPVIEVAALSARLSGGDVTVLDVRRAAEFDAGHIPTARNVTHVQLSARLDEVPRDKPVMVSCRSGVRSARATSLLRRAGFDATNVAGGFVAWEISGGEVVQ